MVELQEVKPQISPRLRTGPPHQGLVRPLEPSLGQTCPFSSRDRWHRLPSVVTEGWWDAALENTGDCFYPMSGEDPLDSLLQGSVFWDLSGHP